eukprot:4047377-Lingulodinium_polyedra.AAC.1
MQAVRASAAAVRALAARPGTPADLLALSGGGEGDRVAGGNLAGARGAAAIDPAARARDPAGSCRALGADQ